MTIETRLRDQGIVLPTPPPKGGLYTPCRVFAGSLAYLSGCGPDIQGQPRFRGKLGRAVTIEQGQQAACQCVLNALAVLQARIGTLDRVTACVKMLAFVACDDDFVDQPKVANGASQLLIDVFGEAIGCPARSAVGHNALPNGFPVEVELLVEFDPTGL